jgi:hypothetical protein
MFAVAPPTTPARKAAFNKPASQFHRERKEKAHKKLAAIESEYGRRGEPTPDQSEHPLDRGLRGVRDVALGLKQAPKGGVLSKAVKYLKAA